jgi:mannose-6-phosphate isomerase-like protein (cupin superfamily)
MIDLIDFAENLRQNTSFELQGHEIGNATASIILIDYPNPGMGPKLHRHPYPEIFVAIEGQARFTVGNESVLVRAGQIAVAPANVPHKFVSVGDEPLRQVDIHCSPTFETEWLDDESGSRAEAAAISGGD